MIMSSTGCKRNHMNPLNIQRDIHNSLLISFYLDLIPVSLISLPYPYSFLTLSTILYDSVYIFYCCTFVVHHCYLLVSALKCRYSYSGRNQLSSRILKGSHMQDYTFCSRFPS